MIEGVVLFEVIILLKIKKRTIKEIAKTKSIIRIFESMLFVRSFSENAAATKLVNKRVKIKIANFILFILFFKETTKNFVYR